MKNIIVILLLLVFSLNLLAGSNDIIKTAGDTKDFPNADYLIVYDSTIVDVQESGLSYNNVHKMYKVLTVAGAKKLNHITFDYDPLSAYVELKAVTIYRNNGEIDKLDMSEVYDYPAAARAIYWGARQKMVDIGRLEPGDAIEVKMFKKGFTYALLYDNEIDDSRYIPPMKGHFYDIIEFWYSQPVLEKVYITNVPNTKNLRYKFFHGDIITNKKDLGEKTRYSFTKKDMMPIKRESGMVANSDIAPKLLLTTSPDWEAKSLWFYGVNEDFGSFESTLEIDNKVAEILQTAKTEMDSISFLNHWVADNIRYSGISMGEGEGYTLHTGDMTFTDRCGVCKDKAGMLITMLRAAGFESYPAMTMAGSRIEDIPADQFNHSLTIVKMSDGNYKLLDPTWIPFVREEWSSLEQQQNYLMGLPEGADLMITEISAPENHPLNIKGISTILEDGTLESTITISGEGQSDAALRRLFMRSWKSGWENEFEKELRAIAPEMEIISKSYSDPYAYMDGPIIISFKFKVENYALVTENEIIFTPIVATNIFKRAQSQLYVNTDVKERKYDFRERCSRLVSLSEEITLPAFKEAIYLPENEKLSGSAADYEGNYTIEKTSLKLNETIRIKKRLFKPEEWDNYKSVVEAQNKFATEKVILSR